MHFRSVIVSCVAFVACPLLAQQAQPRVVNGKLVAAPGKRLVELKPHQVERLNRMMQQQDEAQKKGISPERNFQMQQEKQKEQMRAKQAQSDQPTSYAPKR